MTMEYFPFCPMCKDFVEGQRKMEFNESREVTCPRCESKFQAARDVLVPQRVSYLVKPKFEGK
jgi:hypothetical protein